MNTIQPSRVLHYRNAIEPLVVEEAQRQLEGLPAKLIRYIDLAEVIAYALNRLPALYATSEQGWQRMQARAKNQLQAEMVAAVRQGFAAVQRDPLRVSTPLQLQKEWENGEFRVFGEIKEPIASEAEKVASTFSEFTDGEEKQLGNPLVAQLRRNA